MNKEILRLAIPNIVSNITVPLLGMVDIFIAGHLDSQECIGAIAVANIIFNFIYWNFSFLRMGTSGFTAQAYGAQDQTRQMDALLRSFLVAIMSGLIIVFLQFVILNVGFFFIDTSSIVKSYTSQYFFIYIWAAPAVLSMYTFNGWYVGMQNTITPMCISIQVNTVNIILSFLLVYQFNMGLKGIATASLCAQYSGLLSYLAIWNLRYSHLKKYISLSTLKDIRLFAPFFKVNSNILIRTMALVAVTTFFMSASAKLGDNVLSVNALMMQFFILFSYMMDGFAYAAEALTGKLVGADNRIFLKKMIKYLFIWGALLAIIFTCIYLFFTDEILHILTNKEEIILLSEEYRLWIFLIPLVSFSAFLWDGIFVGATASKQMRNSMLIATSVFFLTYCSFTYLDINLEYDPNNVLWISFLAYLAFRGIIQTYMSPVLWKQG